MMGVLDPLTPDDHRVEHKSLSVGGLTYHYMLAKPNQSAKATPVLIHGWYEAPHIQRQVN